MTFSRGPTTGSGCAKFQTTADPQLAGLDDFGDFNYGLLATSPMIDAGNPAPPAPRAVDFHVEPRAIDGPPQCFTGVARRDIGADEFVPTLCDGPNVLVNRHRQETSITSGPKAKVRTRKARVRARFTFVSNEQGSRFLCSLNGRALAACQPPATLTVRARRRARRTSCAPRHRRRRRGRPAPAEFTWKVKRVRR